MIRPDQSLRQISRRDSYDHDPTTASMYDDGHKYSAPGELNWKFAGGPKAEYDATHKSEAPKESLIQHKHHHKHHRNAADTFDHDQFTSSMYDDQWTYSKPGRIPLSDKEKKEQASEDKLKGGPAPVEGLAQHRRNKRDSYDHDPTTASMYDDGHKYSAPGELNWKFAGGPKAEYDASHKSEAPKEALSQYRRHNKKGHHAHHRHHRNGNNRGADTFDHDPDTTSMYDDQHVYSAPGGFQAPVGDAKKSLTQTRHRVRDTYDHDPTTTSMYDDGWKYSDAGALNWKFAGGPKAEYDAAVTSKKPAPPVESLAQRKDSYDHDPTTASMYDDADKIKTYSAAGALNWKFAGGPKAEYDAWVASQPKKEAPKELAQRKDSYDHDPTTASMYDDADKVKTYSAPGALNWKFAGGPKAEYDASNKKSEAPVEALMQRNKKDTFDADSGSTSMYDDQHVYSNAGQFAPATPSENPKKVDPEKLIQVSRKDTFDADIGTTSMYDDQHVYSNAGEFRPAPQSENPKKVDLEKLVQVSKRTHDTFDPDDKNNVGNADP